MSALETILEYLKREKELLLEAEKLTEEMQTAAAEDLPGIVVRRGRFLDAAVNLREKEKEICAVQGGWMQAWDNTASPEKLSADARQIYEASFAVKGVANRIRSGSEVGYHRLQEEKQALREKLDSMDSGRTRTIERYKQMARGSAVHGKK